MNSKPKGYLLGAVVICTIAIATFHSGICEPVGYTTSPSEHGLKNDMQSVLTGAKRQRLDSRLWRGNTNIYPKFMTSELLGYNSESGIILGQDQYQNNTPTNLKSKCKKGEVKHIVQGRFDFTVQASTIHYSSDSVYSDTQVGLRGELQPVVECAATSMTLTVSRRWATQLSIGTGNVLSFTLSQLPLDCGYSIHKSWRDISIGVQYNGCHVRQEGDRYVLPLLWRRIPAKISCPVSPIKSQALDGLSLCCTPFGLTVGIQGPSAENQLNVNVRGEWTPLLELVQHCGYRFDRRNAEIRIAAPFLACGFTSRDGNHALSLQIGEEVFTLTCRTSPTEVPQQQRPQQTPSTKPMPKTPKPSKWAPPFYLAPPHYPLPKRRHKTRIHSNTPVTPTSTSFKIQHLETPQQDEQQNNHVRSPEEYYRAQASSRGSVKVFPKPNPTSSPHAKGNSHTLLPQGYAFNPKYVFYHSPKIKLTSQQPDPGSVVTNPPKLNAPMSDSSFLHPDVIRTNLGVFRNPMRSTHASPFSVFETQIQRGHVRKINDQRIDKKVRPGVDNDRNFAQPTPSVKLIRPSTNQPPPYSSPRKHNTPTDMYYHPPHHFYQLYHGAQGPQGKDLLTAASFPLPKQTPSPIPPRENLQASSGSWFPQDFYRFYHLYHRLQGENLPTPSSSTLPHKTPDPSPSENPQNSFGSYSPHDFYQLYHLYNIYRRPQGENVPSPTTSTVPQKTPDPISSSDNLQASSGSWFPQDFYRFYNFYHRTHGEDFPALTPFTLPQKTPDPIPSSENLKNSFGSYSPQDFYQLYNLYNLYHGPQSKNLFPAASFPLPTQTRRLIPPRESLQASSGSWFPQDFYRLYDLYHGPQGLNLPTPSTSTLPQKTPDPIPSSENLQNSFGSYSPHDLYQLYHFYNLYHGLKDKNVPTPTSHPQQTPKPISQFEVPQYSFGSFFQPELPVQFKQGIDKAEGLNNEGESARSDLPYDFSSWEKWFNMVQPSYIFPPLFPVPEEYTQDDAKVQDHISAVRAQPSTSPCTPGTGSRFHHTVPSSCFTFAVKECIVGEYFVFSLPEFVVEPKVVGPASSEEACALQRQTSNPHLYFVPLQGCGVTKQVIDALTIYQLELELCDTGSLIGILVECSSLPGLPPAETLLILDPLPLQYPVSVKLRIATDESFNFHPEAHIPLSRLRGRLMLLELSLLQRPDPRVMLWVHYCLAYTLTPHTSTMVVYDGCVPGSESQRFPSPSANIQYIVVSSFLSLNSPNPSIVSHVDPEVYFFCLTEACSASDGVCTTGCINNSEQK